MTPDIILVFVILIVSVVFLIAEWIPMEVTALLVLGIVALTGLVTPIEALSGFSNPAVVTVWAVFILSGGLARTGVANVIGRLILRLPVKSEMMMIVVIMVIAGGLSAFMNNVAVSALMLPVVIDIARHTRRHSSRLLMPLAYGSLLGGLTTQIGTPPNILVSDALRDAGLASFGFFDFSPIGLVIMITGILFMALIGRHMLPCRNVLNEMYETKQGDWQNHYNLQQRLFQVNIPWNSALIGKTLASSRLGSALGWNVIGITRKDKSFLAPKPNVKINAGDKLTVEGRIENVNILMSWRQLIIEEREVDINTMSTGNLKAGEITLPIKSGFIGKTINEIKFRNLFSVNVLAIRRHGSVIRTKIQDEILEGGDILLVIGRRNELEELENKKHDFNSLNIISRDLLIKRYHFNENLLTVTVPEDSDFVGQTLKDSRFADAFGSHVLTILRSGEPAIMPEPSEVICGNDKLIVEGRYEDLDVLWGLEDLEIDKKNIPDARSLVSAKTKILEAVLSPHTTIAGKTLRQLNFRAKYGLNVLAIWRRGKAYRSNLRDIPIQFGDALLLLGPLDKLRMLGREKDYIVLTEAAQEEPNREKMKTSLLVMAAVLLPVIVGWVPIYIAAVIGAAFMVLTGCLTMEEAYQQIEWKAVFLIAGMLPLGMALDQSGAAELIAKGVVGFAGPFGPQAVMAGLVGLTFLATCFVPTAALVVLMAPIVLNTSTNMGLSPHALMMGIAMASSASFTTPVAHPANILVMGPGGYRFLDYLKVGGLLTLVILVVILVVMPIFWPLAM